MEKTQTIKCKKCKKEVKLNLTTAGRKQVYVGECKNCSTYFAINASFFW